MDRAQAANALVADIDRLLTRARAGFREVVPELDNFPPDVTDQLVRATRLTVQAFSRYLREGALLTEDRHMLAAETHIDDSPDRLLTEEQVRSLTLAMLAAMRAFAPGADELGRWWAEFIQEATRPQQTVSMIHLDQALAELEAEDADIA